uniref:helix-turn-helix transcriptional regulator n=1 Tax=Nonomuraea pusilla TaxID=46177 RepID=UPI0006E2AB23|nr:PAS domain-containing protein [Nonomuraea pusilla]
MTPTTRSRDDAAASDSAAEAVFAALRPIVAGIQETFGRRCEVVLHDYRRREHSVIDVAGDVTGRQVGSAMSEIGLKMLQQGDAATDELNYVTRLSDGRSVKSSTMLLRDPDGHVFGALCINFDVTELRTLSRLVAELAGETDPSEAATTTFSNDIDAVIDSVLTEVENELGHSLARITVAQRTEVVRMLEQRGLFQIRRAVPLVAKRLGLSRASIYNHIARLRESDQAGDEG